MLVVEFNTDGTIADHLLLDTSLGVFGAEIPPKTFHTIIPLESCTAVYEVKNGPYHPINDKDFASWAPREGETGCIDYLNGIIKRLGIL
jgi:cupin fold WbuC family metalloprotein